MIDITGNKYNFLTAIKFSKYDKEKQKTYWIFKCDCGKEIELRMTNVLTGNTKSCGCMKKISNEEIKGENNGHSLKKVISNNIKKKTNKTGFTGVSWDNQKRKYYAYISYNHKSYGLGRYEKIEDAITARKIAEDEIMNNNFEEYINKKKS